MRARTIAGFVMASMLFAPSAARGNPVPIGEPLEGNSWHQLWGWNSGGADLFAARIVSGGPFESPALRDFNVAGWTLDNEQGGASPTQATAVGPTAGYLVWDMWFEGDMTDSLTWDFIGFSGESKIASASYMWNGVSWSVAATTWNPTREQLLTNIPLPAPVLLGALGLVGMIPLRRRALGRAG